MFDNVINRKPAIANRKPADAKPEAAVVEQLLVPFVAKVEPADPIPVTVVESIKGLAALPLESGAVSIADPRLLDMALRYPDLLGVKFVLLSGYPEAVYTPEFEQATWSLDRAAYEELVGEIATQERISRAKHEQAGARQREEKRAPVLTRDRVKHFNQFEAHNADGSSMIDESGENDDHTGA